MVDDVITLEHPKTTFGFDTPFIAPIPTAKRERAPLTHAQAHYRSKIYTLKSGTNPLLAVASPLISLTNLLRQTLHETETDTLYHHLIHEIRAFESQAQRLNYRAETILVARYVLSTFLDETVLNTDWGQKSDWKNHKLLIYFQQEDWGGDRFFVILDRLCEEPALHIDVLELVYVVLSLGYEGKFRYQDRGHIQLALIIDNLYQKVHEYRLELKPNLNPTLTLPQSLTKIKQSWQPLKLFIVNIILSVLLTPLALSVYWQYQTQNLLKAILQT